MSSALVITSIAAPNEALEMHASLCREAGMDFIVIGDRTSPKDFHLDGCRFISFEEQQTLPFRLAKLLPANHYSRKNLGYLLCRHHNEIIETDDDNYPSQGFNSYCDINVTARVAQETGWYNIYGLFTKARIWPRGFPAERILDPAPSFPPRSGQVIAPIRQGLVDENPDVDAIYRMTQTLPVHFDKAPPVALPENCWCPFNSQNTSWSRPAYLLLYLPSHCTFRMTDIWRSFVAQRIAWSCGWKILFHEATVIQKRNVHSLRKDFTDEVPGYLHNSRICRLLEDLDLPSGEENIASNLLRCYAMLTDQEFIDATEMKYVEAWIYDMSRLIIPHLK